MNGMFYCNFSSQYCYCAGDKTISGTIVIVVG